MILYKEINAHTNVAATINIYVIRLLLKIIYRSERHSLNFTRHFTVIRAYIFFLMNLFIVDTAYESTK